MVVVTFLGSQETKGHNQNDAKTKPRKNTSHTWGNSFQTVLCLDHLCAWDNFPETVYGATIAQLRPQMHPKATKGKTIDEKSF